MAYKKLITIPTDRDSASASQIFFLLNPIAAHLSSNPSIMLYEWDAVIING